MSKFYEKTIQILICYKVKDQALCAKEEVEQYLRETYSDQEGSKDLGLYPRNVEVEPQSALDCIMEVNYICFKEGLLWVSSWSQWGDIQGIQKVPQDTPETVSFVQSYLEEGNSAGKVITGRVALCLKKKTLNFRTIFHFNVEGKIFLTILTNRLSNLMVKNRYQRFCTEGRNPCLFRFCFEHSSILSELIRKAKETKKELTGTVVWFDHANAYGSVPHKSKTQESRQGQAARGLSLQQ